MLSGFIGFPGTALSSSWNELLRFLVVTDKQQACQSTLGRRNIDRSITCDARHNTGKRLRRLVFLIRHSLCFKKCSSGAARAAYERAAARFDACI